VVGFAMSRFTNILKTEKSGSTCPSNVRLFLKEHFLEGSQALHICSSGKSDMQMKMSMEHWWKHTVAKTPKYLEKKTFPTATLSTTNLTWTGLGSNPGVRGERAATNILSHGTTLKTEFDVRRSKHSPSQL
jgi:hypothetical protein